MPAPVRSPGALPVPAPSRRVLAVLALAIVIVLLTLAAALVIENLDWFVVQGWALRLLAVVGLVAWPRLGRMGRVGAIAFAAGVTAFSAVEFALLVAPELGSSGALDGLAIPFFFVAAIGFFLLVFGAIRSVRGPWWVTLALAGALAALTGLSALGTTTGVTEELAIMQVVSQGYLLVATVVASIAALIDGVRAVRRRRAS
ncbi:hypothetical protein EV140_0895 [Microcella alkaliphila]|uniref:Uncharacterized protein n=1 Tax=Microcella alkaliphila TaxID=279828 RepID=A0A4Q7TS19_9MICO|nr:hypothetical protein [Microcella alkaliphila]RZT62372.1 hypothetical protein EV140_0895 [Microcella alkaliphila]